MHPSRGRLSRFGQICSEWIPLPPRALRDGHIGALVVTVFMKRTA